MEQIRMFKTSYNLLPLRPAFQRFGWAIQAAWMVMIFLLVNFVIPGVFPSALELYVVQPVLWLSLAALAVGLRLVSGEPLGLLAKRELIFSGMMLGGIQAVVGVLLGLLLGLGNSPYAREVIWVILNLWFVASRLVGIETARWYLGAAAGRKHQALGFLLAWLVPLILMIPVGSYTQLGQALSAMRFGGQTLLPGAAESMLAAVLAAAGGPLASIGYRGVMQAFEWLSPVLPNLPWMAAALVGVVVPVFGLFATNHLTVAPEKPMESKKSKKENASLLSWLLVAALAVGFIWLNTGVFGVQPALVSGYSMKPTFEVGDLVIVQKVLAADIKVGDVIRYNRDIEIVHRVLQIQPSNNGLVFITKGDNNNVEDPPVSETQVDGKVVVVIPKVGWLSIGIRQVFAWVH